ncbi:hypothetical protein FSP39_001424 [Pinctada imbricata]|uniref:Uncharacterized protein n=1 Tax=Pinctada imbricata TaxID=66713 RepID=A0AA88XCH0_PINIB|nr:hypothetical protein FSP39_001424 [Pinctada imbricata]
MELHDRLSYLFGTEEHVDLRRQLVLLREKLMNDDEEHARYICSGSLGEGVAYPSSDDDVMMYRTSHRVVKSYREATKRGDLMIVPSEFSPGYCLLLVVRQSYPQNLIHVTKGIPFVSSLQWKQQSIEEGELIHGPCQSMIIGDYEYDLARCISCSFWPDIANNWVIKKRPYGWPSRELIQSITENGCYVVPIGDTDSPLSHHEWRMSFSFAERTLMHSLNHVQFLTYNLLRLCLKRVIDREVPNALCSYFMKTTLFFTSEKTSTHNLQVHNVETYVKACLSVLYDYIDHRYCPNYFIPEYNMMRTKITGTNRGSLLEIVRTLYKDGVVGAIHLCGESKCLINSLSLPKMECKLDFELMYSKFVQLSEICLEIWTFDLSYEESEHHYYLYKLFHIVQGFSVVVQKFIFKIGIIFMCYRMMNRTFNKGNKCNYRHHKTIETILRRGYRSDVTTGKLTIATYMYIVGKTESALSHLQRLLSEYPPYVIDIEPNDVKMICYMDVMCGRGYTIDEKIKHSHAPLYILSKDALRIFPFPLRIGISTKALVSLDPLVYTYVLESLCYIRLHHTSLMKSLKCLHNHIGEIKDEYDIACARMCIGIIKYEQGNNQSACRWLGSSYLMKYAIYPNDSEKISRSVMTYIACMLIRRF